MSSLEAARAAIERAGQTSEQIESKAGVVDRVVRSLSDQLETNGFSVRLARLYGLEDPRK